MNSVQPNRCSKATSRTIYSPSSADGFWDSSITADLLLLFDAGTGISCVGGRLRDVGDGLEAVAGGGVL